MKFNLKRPCKDCPFLAKSAYLRQPRARAILSAVMDEGRTFACHKTLSNETHSMCAGALVLLEKNKRHPETDNRMVQIAQRFGMYDPSGLDLDIDIHTPESFVKAHDL